MSITPRRGAISSQARGAHALPGLSQQRPLRDRCSTAPHFEVASAAKVAAVKLQACRQSGGSPIRDCADDGSVRRSAFTIPPRGALLRSCNRCQPHRCVGQSIQLSACTHSQRTGGVGTAREDACHLRKPFRVINDQTSDRLRTVASSFWAASSLRRCTRGRPANASRSSR